jgi:hypothetical protein
MTGGRRQADPAAAFWARVDMSGGPDACWPFDACKGENIYGQLHWRDEGGERYEKAHRRAFELANGRLPKGRGRGCDLIRHTCDFKPCCNPAHLIDGSQLQNVHDAMERGQYAPPPTFRGEDHPRAKLSRAAVRTAREAALAGASCAALARGAGVGWTTMSHALAGRTWADA